MSVLPRRRPVMRRLLLRRQKPRKLPARLSMRQIQIKRRYRYRSGFDRPFIRAFAGVNRARQEAEPVIRIAARIETVLDAQIILVAPALLGDLNTLNFTW